MPAIIVLAVLGSLASPSFLTLLNAVNILQEVAVLAFVTVAESLVIIAGHFDLSLEGILSFAPMLGAWLLTTQPPGSGLGLDPFAAVAVTIAVGAAIGATNGFFIVGLGLNSFLVTLAMQILLVGLSYTLTTGLTISEPSHVFVWLGAQTVGIVPVGVIAAILLFIIASLFMRYHKYGRFLYAIGGNREAARTAGIRVNRIWFCLFIGSGVLAAIGGLVLSGQVDAVTVDQGGGITLTIFAAAAIGGVSLNGGRGYLWGAALGVLLLGLITNVMTLAQVPSQVIQVIQGAIVLAALVINRSVAGRST
ncbi:MAG: ABC transporter permease [Acidimicrobiales bacterium]